MRAVKPAPTHVYIGRAACGCIRAVTVDDPADPKWTAKHVGLSIKDGLTVTRELLGQSTVARCPHRETGTQGRL